MLLQQRLCQLLFVCCLFVSVSCDNSAKDAGQQANDSPTDYGYGYGDGYGEVDHASIKFLDSSQANSTTDKGVADLSFINLEGKSVKVKELSKDKSIVLVIIRGHTQPICPYCSTQTSRLISNYEKFSQRNAEVVVVYPIEQQQDVSHWDEFMESTRKKLANPKTEVPFPILFDVELKSVVQLGIKKDLSKPATYILDKEGQVHFAYVGSTFADRPSIKAMLEQLDRLQESDKQPEKTDPPKKTSTEKKD